ncbi:MAG: hypothetical protein JXQ83_00895, partial [Candidatus Glassbacteria bacterium]|nr:hypothetical protein [Candidatus Glassbacteria bacterium]
HLKAEFPPISEPEPVPSEIKTLGDLRVFPDGMLPEAAIHGRRVIDNWQEASEKAFTRMLPGSAAEFGSFASTFRHKLALVLQLDLPAPGELLSVVEKETGRSDLTHTRTVLGRQGKQDRVELESLTPAAVKLGTLLLVYPEEWGGLIDPGSGEVPPWVGPLLGKGYRVCRVSGYASGRLSIPQRAWDSYSWPWAYNRDNRLNGIQDILTALEYLGQARPDEPLTLAGLSHCGLWCAFAGAVSGRADRVLADLEWRDPGYEGELLSLLPVGSIRRVGDFRTAALLLMQQGLVLLNPAEGFDRAWYEEMGRKLGLSGNLVFEEMDNIRRLAGLL